MPNEVKHDNDFAMPYQSSGAPYRTMSAEDEDPGLSIPKASTDALILLQAFIAGGLGARCAPNGEREGQSPLAVVLSK